MAKKCISKVYDCKDCPHMFTYGDPTDPLLCTKDSTKSNSLPRQGIHPRCPLPDWEEQREVEKFS